MHLVGPYYAKINTQLLLEWIVILILTCNGLILRRSLCISEINATFFLGIWDKCVDALLSSFIRCSLEACGVGSVLLITFIWLYLAVFT